MQHWKHQKETRRSTLKGIGPTYTDKSARCGLRVGNMAEHDFNSKYNQLKMIHFDLLRFYGFDITKQMIDGLLFDEYEENWFHSVRKLSEFRVIDSEQVINKSIDEGKRVLAEGAQGTMLDVDFGSYPFVTSSSTTSSGVCSGLGVSPHRIGNIYGVFKAYCTRVGSGPFPTELNDETGELLRKTGNEFGSTTGRPRRCGWLDIPALNYAIMLNGINSLIMMKTDVLDALEEIRICTNYKVGNDIQDGYPFELGSKELFPVYEKLKGWNTILTDKTTFEQLPPEVVEYIAYIEKFVGLPVDIVSVGPDRSQTIKKIRL
jgi:adenylosuccinate synthase